MAVFRRLRERGRIVFLAMRSLSYNSCRTKSFYIDAAFEPLFWIVDHVAGVMGMVSKAQHIFVRNIVPSKITLFKGM